MQITKLLEDNIGENKNGHRFGGNFLHVTLKTKFMKEKKTYCQENVREKTKSGRRYL